MGSRDRGLIGDLVRAVLERQKQQRKAPAAHLQLLSWDQEGGEPRTPQTSTQPSGCQIASLCPLGSPRPVSPCTLTPPHTSPGPLRTLAISDEIFCKDK